VATPLASLLAAIDERLALMPMIGAAKRRSGLPLEVPEREEAVLDAAVASARSAATRTGAARPPERAVRALFRAQMEAAKEVQWNAVSDPNFSAPEPLPDLNASLRPAVLRIGERIAQLLLALPQGLDPAPVREAAREALRTPRLSEPSILAIADAIAALSRAPRETTAIP
jgi:chorismate mutase